MAINKVLITDHPWPDLDIETSILEREGISIIDAPAEDEETLAQLATEVSAIATCWAKVTEKVIRASKGCQIVCRMGIGLDNIDVSFASESRIPVTNVPDYCVEEVADHAMGLLLAMSRNIGFFHLRTKAGEYNLQAGPPMRRLSTLRLGLIGFGRTGQEVYHRAKAFGLDVVATTPSGNPHGTDCNMVDFEELISTSDLISLHTPLTEDNHHLLDQEAFSKMKPGVLIANTARGPLIDPDALNEAIEQGIVAGAGLDVFEPEPPQIKDPLYRNEKVIATPHAAFVSEESLADLRRRVAEQIVAIHHGQTPPNVVNAEAL